MIIHVAFLPDFYLQALGVVIVGSLAGSRGAAGRASPPLATALAVQRRTVCPTTWGRWCRPWGGGRATRRTATATAAAELALDKRKSL